MVLHHFFVNCEQWLDYITDRGGGNHGRLLWGGAEPRSFLWSFLSISSTWSFLSSSSKWGSLSISSTSQAAWISSFWAATTRGWPHSCNQDPFPGHYLRILLMISVDVCYPEHFCRTPALLRNLPHQLWKTCGTVSTCGFRGASRILARAIRRGGTGCLKCHECHFQ